MAWLRIDDRFTEHRKILQLTPGQRWSWLELLCYCARHNSGHLPANIVQVLRAATPALLEKAVHAGLLDTNTDGSYEVHDWNIYNPKDPGKAERQRRWRQGRRQNVDGDVDANGDAHVDADVDAERDAPHAGARARPVPSPTPGTSPPSSTSRATPDDDDLDQHLKGIRLTGGARNLATVLLTDDPARLEACVTAALEPNVGNRAGYLAQLLLNGSHPEPPKDDTLAAGATGTRSVRKPDPGPCPDCGQTLGRGHLEQCPRLSTAVEDPEPAAARWVVGPPAELLATVGVRVDDPEPRSDPEPRTGGPSDPVKETTTEEARA